MNNLYFNNHWLSSFGGRILDLPQYEIAQRDFNALVIPGRDMELLEENNRYNNVEFKRKIAFLPYINELTARQLANSIIKWLTNSQGYQIYRDTYNTGYFTKAYLSKTEAIVRELPTLLTTTLNFSRSAFWYSDVGQIPKDLTVHIPIKLYNHEGIPSKPIIRINRDNAQSSELAAKLKINDIEINLHCPRNYDYAILNGENMQYIAYAADGTKTFVNDVLPPDLQIGENIIELTADRSNGISIIPNWRRL